MTTMTVQIRRRGVLTLPAELRRRYDIDEGDAFTLVDLGAGSFLLTSQVSRVAHLGDQVARLMEEQGVTVDEILETLDEEREAYYREHYVQD
jgi:bifunctional DNA-binding transcriptional regulator/antitoxin component of YhaV-PrlF toxin-antitoxin module